MLHVHLIIGWTHYRHVTKNLVLLGRREEEILFVFVNAKELLRVTASELLAIISSRGIVSHQLLERFP